MTSANIQIGAGDVTALLVQRQVEQLEEELARLQTERERHWAVLAEAVQALDAQGEAKFAKLKPSLDAIAAGYRLLSGKGKYVVQLHRMQDKQDHAVVHAFLQFLDRMPWSVTMNVKDARWVLLVGIYRQSDGWTTENLLPPGHWEIPVRLGAMQEKEVDTALQGIRAIDTRRTAIREALKDIPAIERKARAAMTETLLAGLEPSVLRQIEGCMPGQRRVIEAKETTP